jgi:hypothetical protein
MMSNDPTAHPVMQDCAGMTGESAGGGRNR